MKFESGMNRGVLSSRSSGGVGLFIFGLVFFAAGCLIIAAGLGLIPMEGDEAPPALMIIFSMAFIIPGLGIMLGRKGISIDRGSGEIIIWYGLLVPMKTRHYRLSDYNRILLRKEVQQRQKGGSITVYPVFIAGTGDIKEVRLVAPTDYQESREAGEQLAEFLTMPLADASSGKEVVREHDQLDESLRARVQRTGEEIEHVDQPFEMKSQIHMESGVLKIEIPPEGLTGLAKLQLALPLIFYIFVLFSMVVIPSLRGDSEPPPLFFIAILTVMFLVVPSIVMLFKVLPKARKRVEISASRENLVVEEHIMEKTKVFEIKAEELEDFELGSTLNVNDLSEMLSQNAQTEDMSPHEIADTQLKMQTNPKMKGCIGFIGQFIPGPKITAKSDKLTIEFGSGLSHEELSYIHSSIKKIMVE